MTNQKMRQRRDTAENWATANPVLDPGEVGVDLTALAAGSPPFKVGDGSTPWNGLKYTSQDDVYAVLTAPYTLTSTTSLQKLLNSTTNGAITLQPGVYFFECEFSLSGMSSTAGGFGFGFGGTATFSQAWNFVAAKPASITGAAAVVGYNTANAANLIGAANTNTVGTAFVKGILTVTVAGTVIPQVSLTVAAAAVVGAGSYFRIKGVNTSAAYRGAWS